MNHKDILHKLNCQLQQNELYKWRYDHTNKCQALYAFLDKCANRKLNAQSLFSWKKKQSKALKGIFKYFNNNAAAYLI